MMLSLSLFSLLSVPLKHGSMMEATIKTEPDEHPPYNEGELAELYEHYRGVSITKLKSGRWIRSGKSRDTINDPRYKKLGVIMDNLFKYGKREELYRVLCMRRDHHMSPSENVGIWDYVATFNGVHDVVELLNSSDDDDEVQVVGNERVSNQIIFNLMETDEEDEKSNERDDEDAEDTGIELDSSDDEDEKSNERDDEDAANTVIELDSSDDEEDNANERDDEDAEDTGIELDSSYDEDEEDNANERDDEDAANTGIKLDSSYDGDEEDNANERDDEDAANTGIELDSSYNGDEEDNANERDDEDALALPGEPGVNELKRQLKKVKADHDVALPKPKYTGVIYPEGWTKYRARISYNGKYSSLGTFLLQTDAAYAYDQGILQFVLAGRRSMNFNNFEEFSEAREIEMAKRDLSVSLQTTMEQIQTRLAELTSPTKTKLSTYKGIKKKGVRYGARVQHQKKVYFLGLYTLEVDAAYAYDCAAKLLKSKVQGYNFGNEDVYLSKRGEEMERRGLVMIDDGGGVDPLETVGEMIEGRLKIIREKVGEEV